MSVRLAVDIGGTFTDATLIDDESGRIAIAKVLSTPADPSVPAMSGVRLESGTVPDSSQARCQTRLWHRL